MSKLYVFRRNSSINKRIYVCSGVIKIQHSTSKIVYNYWISEYYLGNIFIRSKQSLLTKYWYDFNK